MRIYFLSLFVLFYCAGIAQVNMQNGAAEQSFPLINYTDSKAGLNLGIGINYSSGSGLLVNDIATDVGTGWNLEAGGSIVRVQKGEPDDQPVYDNGVHAAVTNDLNNLGQLEKNYPNGYLYNPIAGLACSKGLTFYPVFQNQTVYKPLNTVAADEEQDQFVFHFNGRTGTFVIGKDWNVTTIGDSRIKVQVSTADMTAQGIRTTINQFVITTEDGIQYTFRDLGLSRISQYKYSAQDKYGNWNPVSGSPDNSAYALNRYWGYPLDIADRPFIVNTWFLSEIKNTNNGQAISFQYSNVVDSVVVARNVSHQISFAGGFFFSALDQYFWNEYHNFILANELSWDINLLDYTSPGPITLVYSRSFIQSKRISQINLPNGGYINFGYDPLVRSDLVGENALTSVDYFLGNKLIRGYQLNYGYLFKNSVLPYNYSFSNFQSNFARLCLLSIQKLGNGDDNAVEPPYKFNYITHLSWSKDDVIPARNYLAQDQWGYYNGLNSGFNLGELLNQNQDFLINPWDYFRTVLAIDRVPKNGYAQLGLLSSVTYPTGGSITYTYTQNSISKRIISIGPQLAGGISVAQTTMYDGQDHSKDIIKTYKYITTNNQSSRWGDESPVNYDFSASHFYESASNKGAYQYPGIEYPEMAVSIDASKIFGKALLSSLISAGVQAGVEALISLTAYASVVPFLNIAILVISILKLIFDFFSSVQQSSYDYTLYNQNFILGNPLGGGYSRVEVQTNSPTGTNGKTVYEFTDLHDYPLLIPFLQWPYIQSQRLLSWAYNLPKKITVFDNNGTLVSETDNTYNTVQQQLINFKNINCKCATEQTFSINGPAFVNPPPNLPIPRLFNENDWENFNYTGPTIDAYNTMVPQQYFNYTGHTDLVSTTEQDFNTQGALYNSHVTEMLNDPQLLLQKGKIELKDPNTLIMQITYYPKDFTLSGAIQQLKNNNAIYTPVSTETWQIKLNGSAVSLIDAHVTEYNTYTFTNASGSGVEVKPWRTYKLKTKAPVPLSVIGWNNPAVLLRNPDYYQLENEMQYDNDGNLIETIHYGNVTSYINDYASRYVVASVANASSGDIAYTSFEADGKGSWNFDPSYIENTDKLTGLQSFNLTASSLITRTNLSTASTYEITYWAKTSSGSSVLVNGQPGTLLYSVPYGWSLYTAEVSNVSEVDITGNSLIDELRLYPKGSLMSTVAYENGIGKITDCDANNRLMFYEYDALGRLKIIRDQNRNIIKTYEYNYKQ